MQLLCITHPPELRSAFQRAHKNYVCMGVRDEAPAYGMKCEEKMKCRACGMLRRQHNASARSASAVEVWGGVVRCVGAVQCAWCVRVRARNRVSQVAGRGRLGSYVVE